MRCAPQWRQSPIAPWLTLLEATTARAAAVRAAVERCDRRALVHVGPPAQRRLAESLTAEPTGFVFSPRRERDEWTAARPPAGHPVGGRPLGQPAEHLPALVRGECPRPSGVGMAARPAAPSARCRATHSAAVTARPPNPHRVVGPVVRVVGRVVRVGRRPPPACF